MTIGIPILKHENVAEREAWTQLVRDIDIRWKIMKLNKLLGVGDV